MLETRIITFITVCHEKSFTKAAETLYITQPAVSQQIKSLEGELGTKLFIYRNKTLNLTDAGEELYRFVTVLQSDILQELPIIKKIGARSSYHFGATRTIGNYIMPKIIKNILSMNPDISIDVSIENTQILIERLESGKIDFAFVEGIFDKAKYGNELFSLEKFICIAPIQSKLSEGKHSIYDLLEENIILREPESGSRNIFEQYLTKKNLTTKSFSSICSIGSIEVILSLVSEGSGISFMFEAAARELIENKKIAIVELEDFPLEREFNLIWLKGSYFSNRYKEFLNNVINRVL